MDKLYAWNWVEWGGDAQISYSNMHKCYVYKVYAEFVSCVYVFECLNKKKQK